MIHKQWCFAFGYHFIFSQAFLICDLILLTQKNVSFQLS